MTRSPLPCTTLPLYPEPRPGPRAPLRMLVASCALAALALVGCADDAAPGARDSGTADAAWRDANDGDAGVEATSRRTAEPAPVALPIQVATATAVEPSAASAQQPTARAVAAVGAGWGDGYALVVPGGGWRVVLGEVSKDANPVHGAPRLLNRESYVVHASIPDADLSDAARQWSGATVEVVTDQGARCAARVGRFEYRVDLVPDGYEDLLWPGSQGVEVGARPPALRGAALAAAVWDSSYRRTVTAVVGLLDPGACPGTPVYARRSGSPDSRVATPRAEVPRLQAVLSAFRALPAYAAEQASYERAHAGWNGNAAQVVESVLRWDYVDREPHIQAFGLPGEASALVSVGVPNYGCTDDTGPLWAVFRVDPAADGAIELVHLSSADAPTDLRLLLESGEGGYDFLAGGELGSERSVIRAEQTLASYAPEFHGCGC